jgi:hypothetical protein
MSRFILFIGFIFFLHSAHATWYRVEAVPGYNKIRAVTVDGENEAVLIRIRNLEKIEYIQSDPEKVLIGGKKALQLAQKVLNKQVVWVENLQTEEGEYVGDVYPSFEAVMHAYRDFHIVNGDNTTLDIQKKIKLIYQQMLSDLSGLPTALQNGEEGQKLVEEAHEIIAGIYSDVIYNIQSKTPKVASSGKDSSPYAGDYQRALFTAKAIVWFREKGQNLSPASQKVFADMLKTFQSENDNTARYTYLKLNEFMKQEKFFQELFLNQAAYARGKFTYECLDWFKKRGQFLPHEIQRTFVVWLRTYQLTGGEESKSLRDRLDWMMKNNELYQDFLDFNEGEKSETTP